MSITEKQYSDLEDYLHDLFTEIDEEWAMAHVSLKFEDVSHSITIEIDNMNDRDYGWLKEI
jgi:hypothetical protein